jgi:hypothetical protein
LPASPIGGGQAAFCRAPDDCARAAETVAGPWATVMGAFTFGA